MIVEMTDEKARHLLAESRRLHWAFPSSQGTPIIKGDPTSQMVEQAAQERESYANAARVLLEKGDEEAAVELAAIAWRLWDGGAGPQERTRVLGCSPRQGQ
jgi:hypothetical protein